jgi:hypothetical protein
MTRLFVRLAVRSLQVAGRFAKANDKAALRAFEPLLTYLLLSPAERAKEMSKS